MRATSLVSRFRRFVPIAAIAFAACLPSGCVCSFERDWRAAERSGVPCDDLAGLWEGTWESDYNGHHGRLRAIITRCADGRYLARYHATFAVIIPFAYDTTHAAFPGKGATSFYGEENLGFLAGGNYVTQGEADGRTFVACYTADKDHGTFRMCRVGACCGEAEAWKIDAGHSPVPVVTDPQSPADNEAPRPAVPAPAEAL